MPKMKTCRAAAKDLKDRNRKIKKRNKAYKSHILTKEIS